METTTTETSAEDVKTGEEGTETVSISKGDYEKLNQTLGSLKRELKDLKKPKEDTKETSQTKSEDSALLQKLERISARQAGITHQDDIELARTTAKKWGVDFDDVLQDEDFLVKLGKQQTARDNVAATSNVRGGQGTSQAKNTPEYWIAKGAYPTVAEVPDRATRNKIGLAFRKNATTNGKTFYND